MDTQQDRQKSMVRRAGMVCAEGNPCNYHDIGLWNDEAPANILISGHAVSLKKCLDVQCASAQVLPYAV